eukprot:sb/3469026/
MSNKVPLSLGIETVTSYPPLRPLHAANPLVFQHNARLHSASTTIDPQLLLNLSNIVNPTARSSHRFFGTSWDSKPQLFSGTYIIYVGRERFGGSICTKVGKGVSRGVLQQQYNTNSSGRTLVTRMIQVKHVYSQSIKAIGITTISSIYTRYSQTIPQVSISVTSPLLAIVISSPSTGKYSDQLHLSAMDDLYFHCCRFFSISVFRISILLLLNTSELLKFSLSNFANSPSYNIHNNTQYPF